MINTIKKGIKWYFNKYAEVYMMMHPEARMFI